jgi:hypothetical protein
LSFEHAIDIGGDLTDNFVKGTFDELYVVGAVEPGIRRLDVVLSDGTAQPVALNEQGAFLFRSTERQLAEYAYPASLRLYASSGGLVESVSFPAPA